jgi:hypothetical protein
VGIDVVMSQANAHRIIKQPGQAFTATVSERSGCDAACRHGAPGIGQRAGSRGPGVDVEALALRHAGLARGPHQLVPEVEPTWASVAQQTSCGASGNDRHHLGRVAVDHGRDLGDGRPRAQDRRGLHHLSARFGQAGERPPDRRPQAAGQVGAAERHPAQVGRIAPAHLGHRLHQVVVGLVGRHAVGSEEVPRPGRIQATEHDGADLRLGFDLVEEPDGRAQIGPAADHDGQPRTRRRPLPTTASA